jgi:hypothetical protein
MTNEQPNVTESQDKGQAPKRVRSPYLFPAYNFALARQIAERVEQDGAGSLSEETLAIALHLSSKSSGFQLKALTARQFGLLTKQGEMLSTTPLAKRIFKPVNEDEKQKAMVESFLAIPLFREVALRFKGQPLPQGATLRNILEREFRIDNKRVSDAERVLMDSSRDAGVLVTSGNNIYLSTEKKATSNGEPPSDQTPPGANQPSLPTTPIPPINQEPPESGSKLLTVLVEDFKNFEGKEFDDIWSALGKIVKARSKKKEQE